MGLTSRNLTVNPRLPLRVIFSREYALGTSDNDGATGLGAIRRDAATGTALLDRALTAADAVVVLEAGSDPGGWSSTWTITRRSRLADGREELRFVPPPGPAARLYLRARLPWGFQARN